ncbi:Hypothetical_protein [Hexamita inflata]|uniref:Hypothetical_protein n=1 Tax=Hexamita inflata TaxID=28002 RepID=A0AA86RLW1_9EUKA|nr:Hypothetical protein HINF_LOCUS64858 [Hexamita inflata]
MNQFVFQHYDPANSKTKMNEFINAVQSTLQKKFSTMSDMHRALALRSDSRFWSHLDSILHQNSLLFFMHQFSVQFGQQLNSEVTEKIVSDFDKAKAFDGRQFQISFFIKRTIINFPEYVQTDIIRFVTQLELHYEYKNVVKCKEDSSTYSKFMEWNGRREVFVIKKEKQRNRKYVGIYTKDHKPFVVYDEE